LKKILSLGLSLVVMTIAGIVEASSSASLPTAVRLVSPLGQWTGTQDNPIYNQQVGVITIATLTTGHQITVVQPTGSNLHAVIDSGVVNTVEKILTGTLSTIINDVGIKDNGNSITVDTPQLPSALDANGNLKVHEQGTANVKLDTNIDVNLGRVKVTDGTDILAVNTDGSLPVQIVSNTTGGSQISGYYAVSVGAGATVEIGSYTVTAGKTLYLESFCLTFKGDSLCHLKVGGVNKNTIGTTPIVNTTNRYLGNNYAIPAGTVMAAVVTNNEAAAITAYFSYHGTEK